jgi:hypothetical protein
LNGKNGGSGGGCSEKDPAFAVNVAGISTQGNTYWNGSSYVAGGKAGRTNIAGGTDYDGGGGGGLGAQSATYNRNGNDGVSISITGTSQFYAAGGGGGQYCDNPAWSPTTLAGLGGSGVGGNGRIWNRTAYSAAPRDVATSGTNGTGSGGGGGAWNQNPVSYSGSGGSGIVIMRYRKIPITANSSIEFIRGVSSDSNMDYKIGNYNGDFKILFSTSNIDIEYFKITPSGPSIYNPTGSPNWATTSDRRIKENIEEASYDKCYENISNLGLFRFNYIKEFNNNNKDIRQLGFIAQEVNEIFPKAVSSYNFNNGDLSIPNLLSIDITQINYSLYGAVKKLITINKIKKLRVKKLESLCNIDTTTSNLIY